MAIVTTTFTALSRDANYDEMKSWMQENASGYFDDITADDSAKTITCVIDGHTVLQLPFTTSAASQMNFYICNGAALPLLKTPAYFKSACKTDNGFRLTDSSGYSYFFSKASDGNTCFVTDYNKPDVSSNAFQFRGGNCVTSSVISNFGSASTMDNLRSALSNSASLTAMCPVVFDGGTYAPNIFYTPFSQYRGIDATLNIDGTQYTYDGLVALK